MSEPVIYDEYTNPCRMCDGERTVMSKEWTTPSCWVICECGNSEGANTIPEALTVWNDTNPAQKG